MRILGLQRLHRSSLLKVYFFRSICLSRVNSSFVIDIGKHVEARQTCAKYSSIAESEDDTDKRLGKTTLAKSLAFLVEESVNVDVKRVNSRMEFKRSLQLQIKKKVKASYRNGKFRDLMKNVIAIPSTLQEAYDCVRINSNIDVAARDCTVSFESMAKELSDGCFDVHSNTFSISTKGSRKEVLVLPNLNLKVLQEAIRIVLEVVYKPHFSKISHGCRSGRGHSTALKYISKEISNPDWWFTVQINKKMDAYILSQLISIMEDKIVDPKLFAIMQSMFDAKVINLEFGGYPKGHGLPQEGVLSPILINIYLSLFDCEFYRLSMKYEAFSLDDQEGSHSNLRKWFRRKLKEIHVNHPIEEKSSVRVHCCRFMDEIFFAVSGSKDIADSFKSETLNYLRESLHLDIDNEGEMLPCGAPQGVRFLGALVRRHVKESPTAKAVHKLKEKVELFALQKQEAWNAWTVIIGRKWLGHGLKKVKESEIKHLANCSSALTQISCFRKAGMETDHWYKVLLKIWMQDVKAREAESEEVILSKYVVEPALPQELRDSFYELQRHVEEYVSSETASTAALLPNCESTIKPLSVTQIIAPVNSIKKRFLRYRLTTSKGYPCTSPLLILQDNSQIIDWFSGVASRWLRWYRNFDNFNEVKELICNQVRMSCIRTLAAKHRMDEKEIEKRFDLELSKIPSTEEIELETDYKMSNTEAFDDDEELMYGISNSGLCLLSLARMVSQSRPCNCFIMGCSYSAPSVYTLHIMERQKFPGWKTGFSSCIHPSLNRRRIGLCQQHLKDLYLGHISLQSVDFGAWK